MACDICGKSKQCKPLNSMLDWSIGGGMIICDTCARVADTLLGKYRSMAWSRTKKKLKRMQKEKRKEPHDR